MNTFKRLLPGMAVIAVMLSFVGCTFNGIWDTRGFLLFNEYGSSTNYYLSPSFPVGLSYLPIRVNSNRAWFYGWLEFVSTNYNDGDPNDAALLSRFAVSATPGLRVRMGEE